MTEENLAKFEESEHAEFWENLREGWEMFEQHRRPPKVDVVDGRYVFQRG